MLDMNSCDFRFVCWKKDYIYAHTENKAFKAVIQCMEEGPDLSLCLNE